MGVRDVAFLHGAFLLEADGRKLALGEGARYPPQAAKLSISGRFFIDFLL